MRLSPKSSELLQMSTLEYTAACPGLNDLVVVWQHSFGAQVRLDYKLTCFAYLSVVSPPTTTPYLH